MTKEIHSQFYFIFCPGTLHFFSAEKPIDTGQGEFYTDLPPRKSSIVSDVHIGENKPTQSSSSSSVRNDIQKFQNFQVKVVCFFIFFVFLQRNPLKIRRGFSLPTSLKIEYPRWQSMVSCERQSLSQVLKGKRYLERCALVVMTLSTPCPLKTREWIKPKTCRYRRHYATEFWNSASCRLANEKLRRQCPRRLLRGLVRRLCPMLIL